GRVVAWWLQVHQSNPKVRMLDLSVGRTRRVVAYSILSGVVRILPSSTTFSPHNFCAYLRTVGGNPAHVGRTPRPPRAKRVRGEDAPSERVNGRVNPRQIPPCQPMF